MLKKKIGILITFLSLLSFQFFAQEKVHELETDIQTVKIHLQGAEIIRTAELNLGTGAHQIVFTDLSPKINPQSVQVTATNGIDILSISSKINFLKEQAPSSPKISVLKDSVDLLMLTIQNYKDEEDAIRQAKVLLEQNRDLGGKKDGASVEDIMRATDYYREKFIELNGQLSSLTRKKNAAQKTINLINSQLRELNAGNKTSSEIYISANTKKTTTTKIRLRYVVMDAGWSPIYDLQTGNLSEPIQLKYRALAFNNTGVNWEQVKITLSTSDPMQSASMPVLLPWKLRNNIVQDLAEMKARPNLDLGNVQVMQSQNMVLNNAGISKDKQKKESTVIRFEEIEVPELSSNFEIEEPYTIPADKKPYSIDINSFDLDANYKHYSVPKMEKEAFLLAQITGWEELELIAGPMNIYNDETYIGLSNLESQNVNDTLALSLGRDNRVLVKRVKQKELSKKQFLGSHKKLSLAYVITVKNNRKQAIDFELLDQVPVSTIKEITVDVKETSKATLYDDTGKLEWLFRLGPGESRTFNFTYSIKYPKNREIQLERTRKVLTPRYF